MVQLPEEIYLPSADEPAGVFVWGKSPEQTESDLAAWVARIGGNRSPDYGQAYLLAANTLLRTAKEARTLDHHSLPIFFLQRHAAELMLKSPLTLGSEIQERLVKLGRMRVEDKTEWPEDKHELGQLLEALDRMTEALQVCHAPLQLRQAIQEILELEQQHTWSRYAYRKYKGKLHMHMDQEVVIPLGRIQDALQKANVALGSTWPFNPSVLMGSMGEILDGLLREAGEYD